MSCDVAIIKGNINIKFAILTDKKGQNSMETQQKNLLILNWPTTPKSFGLWNGKCTESD